MMCVVFTLKGLPLYMYMSLQETLIPEGRPGGDSPTAHSQLDILKGRQLLKISL